MRVGVIDVGRLTQVRRTFRPLWRIFIILSFLFLVFAFWLGFNQVKDVRQIATDDGLKRQLLILTVVLFPILGTVFLKKNGFARLTFALIILPIAPLSLGLLIFFLILGLERVPTFERGLRIFLVLMILGVVIAWWEGLVARSYVLFLSVMPFWRWKAFRNQVASSLLLWAGKWKSQDDADLDEKGEPLHPSAGTPYRLIFGTTWFIFGVVCVSVGGFGTLHPFFLSALFHLQFAQAWHFFRDIQTWTYSLDGPVSQGMLNAVPGILVLLLGFVGFAVFGFFWHQWRRENTLVFRKPLLQHMTASDVLLLRTFTDDGRTVFREQRVWLLPFRAYTPAYTLEQLIVNRLRYLGKVRMLDIETKNEELLQNWWLKNFLAKKWLKWLLEKQWAKRLVASQRLKTLLISMFPTIWYKLPLQWGMRYYVDNPEDKEVWQEQVLKAMGIARMIVVLLGTTESLEWEMNQIQASNLSEKTVFVMPPVTFKKGYRARWQQFIKYLNDNRVFDTDPLKKVKPQRVRAVCVHHDTLLVLTGKKHDQLSYEAALDIATLFTVADPADSRRMIHKYLT